MGKIMSKLKHNYNAFHELQTKFFHKQCVISSFPPSLNEFHRNFHILKISGIILVQLTMRKNLQKVASPAKLSKDNQTSPK